MDNTNLTALSNQLADAVERAGQSVVTVNGRERQAATGIVIGADLILTADHVLEREDNLSVVTGDGRAVAAHFVGRDPATDLAVLRAAGLGLPAMAVATAARVGQLAVAIGRPDSGGLQASLGVISQIGGPVRMGRGPHLDTFIRTDATPYPGFSGGPLIDAAGAAYGVLTTGLIRGVAIVIPVELALRVANAIASGGSTRRGYLGLVSQAVKLPPGQRPNGQATGLLVMRVEDGSPAEQGGLMVGDILLALDDHPVTDADELLGMLAGDRVGKRVAVGVLRGGAPATVHVLVGERK